MTVISKGTPAAVTRGSSKVVAGYPGEVVEIMGFDALFARCAVRVKGFAGDYILGMFSADGTCLVHTGH